MVGAVQQAAEMTRFAFEPGCQLRMKITKSSETGNGTGGGKGKR